MRLQLISIIVLSTMFFSNQAQPGWNWPENKSLAEEKNTLYADILTLGGDFNNAVEPHNWLLENAPNLNPSIYINGVKLYKKLAESESDVTKKREYQEMILRMYDLRMKYFNDEANVLNRKAYDAYKILKGDESRYEELFQIYERTFELKGNDVGLNNLVSYMDVIRRYQLKTKALSDEGILERYDKLMSILDFKEQNGGKVSTLKKNRDFIDSLLPSIVDVNCDFIENKLGPKLTGDPENLKLAKKIIGLSLAGGCGEIDIFFTAAEVVQKQEPTYGMAKILALKMERNGDKVKADKYFKQATELAETADQKAEIFYTLAGTSANRGNKPNARKYALNAVNAVPSKKEAYKFIGDLYMTSYKECKKGVSKVQDRAIFIAAYDMYRKAGNSALMKSAQEQFPSIEEIFELDLQEGQTLTVGCWINETVIIQRR